MPVRREPAFHVCRFPVPAPRSVFPTATVWFPKLDAGAPFSLGIEKLLLPMSFGSEDRIVVPSDVGAGLALLWTEDPASPLLVPLTVIDDRRFHLNWPIKSLCTPRRLGLMASEETITTVAWAVLARAPFEAVASLLVELSRLADRFRLDPAVLENVVRLMKPPRSIAGPLLAAARGGEPILHARAVMWILRELAAVADEERARHVEWRPTISDDASYLAHAWFPFLSVGGPPRQQDVLLAVWMLHDAYHGSEHRTPDKASALSMTTALGYRSGGGADWLTTLERSLAIWTTPDDDPAVAGATMSPSGLRSLYRSRRGVAVESFLAGAFAICSRLWLAMESGGPTMTCTAEDFFSLPLDTGTIEFSGDFVTAFRETCVASLASFGAAARAESSDGYHGLGSLTQSDSLACRNSPIIELADGRLLVLSVDLLAERVTSLHGLRFGRGTASSTYGKMFEAYVCGQIARLRSKEVVLLEDEITAIVGVNATRCDAVVGDGHYYVAIEVAQQSLSRAVAAGEVASIEDMAERYQHEADQAVATVASLPEIARLCNLPTPHIRTHLVVTDTPIAHSPLLLDLLQTLRPDRTAKFLCSVEDLELLVELGVRGWSVPGAVIGWQQQPNRTPFRTKLTEMARTLPPRVEIDDDAAERWFALLPRRTSEAA